ncbi:hypothetical protein EKD04_021855 [Chloroflexales bacterium ZM16-3]|nr:hypothetical protein [Chloroflexales bacterium ZM16-3]
MSNNILTARIAIQGTRPFLWHAFTPDAIPIGKTERSGVAGNDPSEWARTVLAREDGQLYIRNTYIFGCLRDGAKHTPLGRGSLQAKLVSTLQVAERIIPLVGLTLPSALPTDENAPVFLDVQSVRNPATRARNVRYRIGAGAGWQMEFHITWDKTVVSRDQMQAVAYDAGRLAGIGDGRAIGYGRFAVTAWAITDTDEHPTGRG